MDPIDPDAPIRKESALPIICKATLLPCGCIGCTQKGSPPEPGLYAKQVVNGCLDWMDRVPQPRSDGYADPSMTSEWKIEALMRC